MFAVLHVADFALHAVLRTEPGVARQPAALFSGQGKKSLALAANAAARAAGVEPGMTTPQAVARCARLVIRSPQPAAEAEARAALLAAGFTLSPSIEATAPGICTVALNGVDSVKLEPVVRTAVAELVRLDLPATAGIAATPLLALYAARRAQPDRAREHNLNRDRSGEFASKIPSTSRSVLLVTDATSFLAPLPLASADPPPELAAVLASWGLHTLGDLTTLPRDDIVHRFGTEALALWQRASGGAARPLHLVAPPQTFFAEMEFEQGVETIEPLLFVLRRLLDRLTLELRGALNVAAELALTLRLEDDTSHARSFRLPEPTADAEILFRTLHTHLESLQTSACISAVQLNVTPTRPLVRQQGLFETGLRDPHGFAETLTRVSALVGADRVGTPQIAYTHRPDAVKLLPPPPVISPLTEQTGIPPLSLPLRHFRPPLRAGLTDTSEGKVHLWADGLRGEISFRSPPYHRCGDWWQHDRAWQRTEWDIELAEGGLFRLVHAHDTYFIEGEYD